MLSGVFDAYPGLRVILGHMGEGLPFYLWRISHGLRASMSEKSFRDIFCEHFYITTSGFFSNPALLCCVQELGVDRIMFSIDYPFVLNKPGTDWFSKAMLNLYGCRKAILCNEPLGMGVPMLFSARPPESTSLYRLRRWKNSMRFCALRPTLPTTKEQNFDFRASTFSGSSTFSGGGPGFASDTLWR